MRVGYTPGPWSVFPHWCKNDPDPGPYGETLLIGKGQYDTLAEVRPGSDDYGTEYEANARLIAAAPDLLEACSDWIAWLDGDGWREDAADYEAKMLAAMRAAIAKAIGAA